jgi:RNA polymerase sigma factor (sigma-70 family)
MSESSVTRWIARLEQGDDRAVERLWQAYFERLVHLAHNRLQLRYQRTVDAEDVALSAFYNFCKGVEQKKYPELRDRHGLWRLLVCITINKVLRVVRDQNCLKRGGHFNELRGFDENSDSLSVVNDLVSREPSPEFAMEIADQYEALMKSLGSEELTALATWKLEGLSNAEIAERWNCSKRTVERKLELIRKIWIRSHVDE